MQGLSRVSAVGLVLVDGNPKPESALPPSTCEGLTKKKSTNIQVSNLASVATPIEWRHSLASKEWGGFAPESTVPSTWYAFLEAKLPWILDNRKMQPQINLNNHSQEPHYSGRSIPASTGWSPAVLGKAWKGTCWRPNSIIS